MNEITQKNFKGFTPKDFAVFSLPDLETRMPAIRSELQPKFKYMGDILTSYLEEATKQPQYLHIAKHLRRRVNPPNDTWFAIGNNKRGYKKHPHFQCGLYNDHVFIWLAFLNEIPNKRVIAENLKEHEDFFLKLSPQKEFYISGDHKIKGRRELTQSNLEEILNKFSNTAKGEFLVGKYLDCNNEIVANGDELIEFVKKTFKELLEVYVLTIG